MVKKATPVLKSLLIVEDDPVLNANIQEALKSAGFHVDAIVNGKKADEVLARETFDCVVLDIQLPGMGGYDICRRMRERSDETPVLLLTAYGELEDKVSGFDAGADDYLTKPFYMRELILRIQALIKRGTVQQTPETWEVNDLAIDEAKKMVSRQGVEINLTPREYQILLILLKNKGDIVSKQDLIKAIWGRSFDANTNTIEVYINFLRKKVDRPFQKDSIKTKVGYGYYFDTE